MTGHVPAATLLGTGVVLGLLGYVIRVQHRLSVLTERESDAADRPERTTLATVGASASFLVGGLTAALGVLVALDWTTVTIRGWYTAFVVAAAVAAVVVNRLTGDAGSGTREET